MILVFNIFKQEKKWTFRAYIIIYNIRAKRAERAKRGEKRKAASKRAKAKLA